jgi:hypothetical protein
MYAVTVPEPGYSKATLLVAIGSSAVAGLALGYAVAKRELAAAGKANKASRVPSNLTGGTTWRSGGSENSTPGELFCTWVRSEFAGDHAVLTCLLPRS